MWSVCRYNVLNMTKMFLFRLLARDWLSLDARWSKDAHYDRLRTV